MRVELRPHQEEAVAKMHNGCVLYGGVGVGKTITSLGYYFSKVCGGTINEWGSLKTPKDVYVITTAKVRDSKAFELQAAHFGIHEDPAISTNGVKITVDSWNNLKKYVEVKDAFFIFDEQRVVGYGAWSRAFIKVAKHNEWVLLSATPGDTWMDYIPVFIANGFYKHKTDFIDQHVIWTPRVKYPKVLRYQNIGALVRRRNDVLVHMPVERHTVRHHVDVWCDYDEDAFQKAVKKRWHVFEERPLRDVAELFGVMRKVVNTDSSRLEALKELTRKHPRLIVFYNFDYELEMLRSLGEEVSNPSSTAPQSGSDFSSPKLEMLKSLGGPTGSDPLEGTIWEKGFDEKTGKMTGSSPTARDAEDDTATTFSTAETKGCSISSGTANAETSFAIAEWNGHRHEEIPTTDRWVYLVQYRAGAEGWNCIDTDAVVFFSQTYSYRDWWQAHGRIDRINTPFVDLWYYHFVSRSLIDKAIRKALKVKKSFNERDLHLEAA